MWVAVLVVALLTWTDPVRVAIAVLLVSRPRPLLNLVVYWLGGIVAGLTSGAVALLLFGDLVPVALHGLASTVGNFTGGYVRIAMGVLALLFAAIASARFSWRQRVGVMWRQRAGVPIGFAPPAILALQPSKPSAFSRLSGGAHRLLETDHLALAFVAGIGTAIPPIEFLVALNAILASGATFGTQLGAITMYTLVVLVMVEIPLVSYFVAPEKTQVGVLQLQSWMRTHCRRLLTITAAVAGVLLVSTGMAGV